MWGIIIYLSSIFHICGATFLSFSTSPDALCNPRQLPIFYTGFRVYSAATMSFPVRHFWYIIRCAEGRITDRQYFCAERNANYFFGDEFCFGEGKCYVISRKRKYGNRDVPVFRPFASIGAIYKIQKNELSSIDGGIDDNPYDDSNRYNDTTYIPLAPVLADNTANILTLGPFWGSKTRYMPILYTSEDVMCKSWDKKMNVRPDEAYVYTDSDKEKLWYRINVAVTKILKKISLKKELLFWEYDPVKLQLKVFDWRKPLNRWLFCNNCNKKKAADRCQKENQCKCKHDLDATYHNSNTAGKSYDCDYDPLTSSEDNDIPSADEQDTCSDYLEPDEGDNDDNDDDDNIDDDEYGLSENESNLIEEIDIANLGSTIDNSDILNYLNADNEFDDFNDLCSEHSPNSFDALQHSISATYGQALSVESASTSASPFVN